MVLTAQQQFRLRAKKALDTGDTTFKPRGKNKEIFETMKQEHDKTMAQRQNSNLKRTKQQHTHEQDQKKRVDLSAQVKAEQELAKRILSRKRLLPFVERFNPDPKMKSPNHTKGRNLLDTRKLHWIMKNPI